MVFIYLVCSLLLLLHENGATDLKCDLSETIIFEGNLSPTGDLSANGYVYTPGYYQAINRTHFSVCVCSIEKCVKKCCAPGMAYNGSFQCSPTSKETIFEIYDSHLKRIATEPSKNFQLIHSSMCKGKYNLEEDNPNDQYFLLNTGKLFMPNAPEGPENVTFDRFCIDNIVNGNDVQQLVLVCFKDKESEIISTAYPVGVIISIPFLLITFIVYAILPDLRSLINGKNLMCQIAAMIVAYSCLAGIQLTTEEIEHTQCMALAYSMQYAFLATFFWLNVTSYDLWWTFGGFRGILSTPHRDTLKFVFYSIYAWGGPLILMGITLGLDLSPNLPDYIIRPEIGKSRCWFDNDKALFAYFYGPIAAILLINLIFFSMTAYKIFSVNKENNQTLQGENSRRSSEATKQKFFLYLKLFFIMGANWILEVISAAHNSEVYKYLFIVSDICNALQGVLICYFFVGATKTKELIHKTFRASGFSQRTTGTYNSSARVSRAN